VKQVESGTPCRDKIEVELPLTENAETRSEK
jgi:hypothetical protein